MATVVTPKGDSSREAIDALKGYVYQIYQSALAWIELEPEEFLFLEVAEDYAIVTADALNAVQVKGTGHTVTINSPDIVASINSFVDLKKRNPALKVRLRHLTTSKIGKEKKAQHRIDDVPTLETWRKLARIGDLAPLRKILEASNLSMETKEFIRELNDTEFREDLLKRIYFDCGALETKYIARKLRNHIFQLIAERGGVHSQVHDCLANILIAVLQKSTQKSDRVLDRDRLEELLDKATQIPVNRAQFEIQNRLVTQALTSTVPQAENRIATRLVEPRPIDEVPIPKAIASRTIQINNTLASLTQFGLCWIYGAAGVGKTVGAKIAARHLGGDWAIINLRGLNAEQVEAKLSSTIDSLTQHNISGLLVDDFESTFEPYTIELLLYLHAICSHTDLLLLFTSPKPPSPDFLYSANLPVSIAQKFNEFSEQDITEILTGLGVEDVNWSKYIYAVSGFGHPQLAIAAIQSIRNSGWDLEELKTLNSLLVGNTAVEQVRARTRERLLREMTEGSRRLLERLSLKTGGFRRSFVLDMAHLEPVVSDGGIVFDQLIGSWIDQQEKDQFSLSPLLSNFALNTLTTEEKQRISFEIANSLVKGPSLNPIDANSALLAALSGKNTQVILTLCMTVIGTDQDDLEMIAPYLSIFTFFRTDTITYKDDPATSQLFRGAQLLLMHKKEEDREKLQEVIDCFETESKYVAHDQMRNVVIFLVYSKLLLATSKNGALLQFWKLILKLYYLLQDHTDFLPAESLAEIAKRDKDGLPVLGLMFLNQARQIRKIDELLSTFEFLNSCREKLRDELLKPFLLPEFDTDMLVSGAWLAEHDAKTIDPPRHSTIFSRLEEAANAWRRTDIAVCCRKYRAIILDEYAGSKEEAISILDEGLQLYGESNSELVRAKAKVFYRSGEHSDSLKLSKALIDGDAPLSKTEKAFLGREAAISAEEQKDYQTARLYYLYGSEAAKNCKSFEMAPMWIGLLGDAALASWHDGDRETCLRGFTTVLHELNSIDPRSSLRAAHCHATCRHVLLWLDQYVTGRKCVLPDGDETKIYAGIISNPEPHSDIGDQYITPIEMAWYMLATIENNSLLDVGITQNLEDFLPKGPVFEGQFYLTPSKMNKALMLLDTELFVVALAETVTQFAYIKEHSKSANCFDIKNITYGLVPAIASERQADFTDLTEQLVLCYASKCIFVKSITELENLQSTLEKNQDCKVRKVFLGCLQNDDSAMDYNTATAVLVTLHKRAITEGRTELPLQVFEMAFRAAQIASMTGNFDVIAKPAFEWLEAKWGFIWINQQFLLNAPGLHEKSVNQALSVKVAPWPDKLLDLLLAVLPLIGFNNETQLRRTLEGLRP